MPVSRLRHLNSCYPAVHKISHCSACIMVIRNHHVRAVVAYRTLSILIKSIPALPYSGCPLLNLIEPRRTFLIKKHPVRNICPSVISQRKKDIRCSGKACPDTVIIFFNKLHQIFNGILSLLAIKYTKI